MKNTARLFSIMLVTMFTASSCEVIGGIFKAGVWTGIFIVVAVVALIIYLIASVIKRK